MPTQPAPFRCSCSALVLTATFGLALSASVLAPRRLQGQTGGFLVRLGSDTVAVERYQKSADKIEGSIARRFPQANILKYTVALNRDGTVASYEQSVVRPDGSPAPNAPTGLRMTFTGDSVIRQTVQNNQPVTLRSAAPKGTLPTIGGSWLWYEMMVQTARRDGAAHSIGFNAQQAAPTKADVRLIGTDSAEIVGQGFRTGAKLDRNGRVTRGDGSLTTQKFIVTPLANADVAAIAAGWAAKDAAGQPPGAMSPRDTVNATIGAAQIWIDYGRPAKRGREIWGKLVPYDTTWRLGANAATQFRTDKDLDMGGVSVPAGTYTLWLYPTADKAWLIVNSQTGQWGTAYDASKDVVRVPLEKHTSLPSSEERFRIFVQGDMLMMHWDTAGYGVKVTPR